MKITAEIKWRWKYPEDDDNAEFIIGEGVDIAIRDEKGRWWTDEGCYTVMFEEQYQQEIREEKLKRINENNNQ